MNIIKRLSLLLAFAFMLNSCGAFKTALYDQQSYEKAVDIRVEAESLMDKSTEEYSVYEKEIEELNNNIKKVVVYEKNKRHNEITYAMWKLLSDKEKNLLSGYFEYWKKRGTLKPAFTEQAKDRIFKAMDLLLKYEGKKDRESKDELMDYLKND